MSDYLTEANTLRTTKIEQVTTESPSVKTYFFIDKQCANAKPGQFIMLWIPGVDEIPLSILNATEEGEISVSVKAVGDATRHLHTMKPGATIGIRGPFGNNFTIPTQTLKNVLLIGGGTGTAPLLFLAKTLLQTNKPKKLTFIVGARTKDELLFIDQLTKVCQEGKIVTTTNDGTYGEQGVVTDPLIELVSQEKIDAIYTCGPEVMVKKIFETTQKYNQPLEASLERLMRCGIGLCGSCVIGKYRVCKDGPIFNSAQLNEIKNELGISKLNLNGSKISI